MSTVIDSLVVTLGLDASKFTAGQKSAVDSLRKFEDQSVRSGKSVESQGKKLQEFFAGMKREALLLGAAVLGGSGLKEFVSYITSADAATNRLSKTVGVSTRELSAWQGAFRQIGGTSESATESIVGMNDALQKFLLTGDMPGKVALDALGVGLFNAKGQMKDAGEMWLTIAGAISKIDPVRATALLKLLPGANQDMINFALQGRPVMEKYLEVQRQIGVATKESGESAEDYQRALSQLTTSAERLGVSLLTFVTPALVGTMEAMENTLGLVKRKGFALTHFPGLLWSQLFGTKEELDARRAEFHKADAEAEETMKRRLAGKKKLDELLDVKRKLEKGDAVPVKPGAGASSPTTRRVMEALSDVPGINRVTSLNDSLHTTGAHPAGLGVDVTINDPSQSAAAVTAIKAKLAEMGITANVRNEYVNPSARATGGHIHIGVTPSPGLTPGAPAAASISNVTNARAGDSNNSSATTNIGSIVINDASGNADHIASGISGALGRHNLAAPANFGQQ